MSAVAAAGSTVRETAAVSQTIGATMVQMR